MVFLNSFVDLGHKIIIQNIFYNTLKPIHFTIMSALVNGLFLLPYLALFSPSGFIADRYKKAQVIRITAWLAVPMTLFITYCYYAGHFWLAFSMVGLLAIQSTFNSPAKYGYIKEAFQKKQITKANAYVQSIVMVAILAGTLCFSLIYAHLAKVDHHNAQQILNDIAPAGWLLVAGSLAEALLTLRLTQYPAAEPTTLFSWPHYCRGHYLKRNLSMIGHNRLLLFCILALAIFWGVNQVVIAAYGAYLKEVDHASVVYVQLCMGIAIIGIMLGAAYAAYRSSTQIATGLIPIAQIALAILLWILVSVSNQTLIIMLFLIYGFFSGMLVVPLNTLIQVNAPKQALGRVLAGNNFLQFLLMFLFLLLTVCVSLLHIDAVLLFRGLIVISLISFGLTIILTPQFFRAIRSR